MGTLRFAHPTAPSRGVTNRENLARELASLR